MFDMQTEIDEEAENSPEALIAEAWVAPSAGLPGGHLVQRHPNEHSGGTAWH